MNQLSWYQKFYWSRWGKPTQELELFKYLISTPISSVLEIGVGDGSRMRRLARLVRLPAGCPALRYVGVDLFEAANDGKRHMSLKQAHQVATQLGFKATLVPGDARSGVGRAANKMAPSDLIICDGGIDSTEPHSVSWGVWLPRIAHDRTVLLGCSEAGGRLEVTRIDLTRFDHRSAA